MARSFAAARSIPPPSPRFRPKAARASRAASHNACPKPRPLAIIVPIYRGLAETQACLDALFAAAPQGSKIILVDDATPEPALAAWADELAAAKPGHALPPC